MKGLLPCPFCGAAAVVWMKGDSYKVTCSDEDCAGYFTAANGRTAAEAAGEWNKREGGETVSERDAFYAMMREITECMDSLADGMADLREAVERLGKDVQELDSDVYRLT